MRPGQSAGDVVDTVEAIGIRVDERNKLQLDGCVLMVVDDDEERKSKQM